MKLKVFRVLPAALFFACLFATVPMPLVFAAGWHVEVTPVVPGDIRGGAVDADVDDAARFAWDQFIALNWPALTIDGERDVADTTLPFGDPDYTGPLVWHTFRHKVEILPGNGDPAGYDTNDVDFGYSTLPPVYTYGEDVGDDGIVPACSGQDPVASPALINLDETTQIGLNFMFAGVAPTNIDPDVNSFPQAVRFLAQGNKTYYKYLVDPDALETDGDPLYTHPSPCPSDSSDPDYDHTYCEAKRNFTAVSGGNGTPSVIPGIFVDFPAGTILVKGAFRELTDAEAASGRFYKTTVRYYEDISGTTDHCYWEREWGLIGLHIIHKTPTSPNFVFSTFEQVDNLLTADGDRVEAADGQFLDDGGEANSTAPTLVFTDSEADGPALTIVGDPDNEADYCQPETIGDRLFYLEVKEAAPNAGYICQNHRDHSIPPHVRRVNRAAHRAIQDYIGEQGFNDSPFLYYRLVHVQPEPFDESEIDYNRKNGNRSLAAFYLANIMVETDYALQHFSGRLDQGLKTDYPANFDLFNNRQTYQNSLTFDGHTLVDTDNMGGCMGCHGVAQLGGNDFSFVLGGGRVGEPEAPEITPPGTSNPPPGDTQPVPDPVVDPDPDLDPDPVTDPAPEPIIKVFRG